MLSRFTLTVGNMEKFEYKLADLQKTAKKYNVYAPTIINDNVWHENGNENGIKLIRTYHDITIEYEIAKVSGYTFVARIDGQENIFYTAPGQSLPQQHRNYNMNCDSCNVNRLRNDVYVLQHDNGDYFRVGGNCLAKFIGFDAGTVLSMSNFFNDITELIADEEIKCYSGKKQYNLAFTLNVAKFIVDKYGYVSVATAKEKMLASTKTTVVAILSQQDEDLLREYQQSNYIDDYSDYVENCVKWMQGLDGSDSDYEQNLASIATNTFCTYTSLGFAVSAINAYQKMLDNKLASKIKPLQSTSKFVGNVGDKFTKKSPLLVTCTHRSTPFESFYGGRYSSKQYYTFIDPTGNEYTTCTDSHKCAVGDKLSLTCSISGHEINKYTNIPQTILKRCMFTILADDTQ